MATLRQIRRRIRSVQNTAKITRAMSMIAASKMRRAQQRVIAARPYEAKIREVLADLVARVQGADELPALLQRRDPKTTTVIHVTADRGLCGGLNANMNRRTAAFVLEAGTPVEIISIGRKGREFMVRYRQQLHADFTVLDTATVADIQPIVHLVAEEYASGRTDRVVLAYSQFVSTLTQRPTIEELLPIVPPAVPPAGGTVDYIYEPDPRTVLERLLPRYVEMELYHAVLEHLASEQSARMVAMRSATDNAMEMIRDLTLTYNKVRQETITRELLDLVGGAAALEG